MFETTSILLHNIRSSDSIQNAKLRRFPFSIIFLLTIVFKRFNSSLGCSIRRSCRGNTPKKPAKNVEIY